MKVEEIFAVSVMFIGLLCLIAVLLALPTMWLWNWLMPKIFNLTTINFWEALGINLLCGMLFSKKLTK